MTKYKIEEIQSIAFYTSAGPLYLAVNKALREFELMDETSRQEVGFSGATIVVDVFIVVAVDVVCNVALP